MASSSSSPPEVVEISNPGPVLKSLREALQGQGPDIPEDVISILEKNQISFGDLKQGLITEEDFQTMNIAIGPRRRLLALRSNPTPTPDPILDRLQRIETNQQRLVEQLHQPQVTSYSSYAELFAGISGGPRDAIQIPGGDLENADDRLQLWERLGVLVKDEKYEDVIQKKFVDVMKQMGFNHLDIYDTHKLDSIANPQKPDVTVVPQGLLLLTQSVAILFELRASHRTVDGKMKGQLISAVDRVWLRLPMRRDLWGFAMNGGNDATFVYCRQHDGSRQMGETVNIRTVLLLIQQLDRDAEGFLKRLPAVENFTMRSLLGSGKTSDVYCVEDSKKNFMALKVPKDGYQHVITSEGALMEVMLQHETLNKHLDCFAKIHQVVSVSIGENKKSALLTYPCGDQGKPGLIVEEVVKLAKGLQCFHEAGFFHRDISPSNIGHIASKLFFRDFGFSVQSKDNIGAYQGALATASKRVLQSLKGSTPFDFDVRDDFESLLKTIIIITTGHQPRVRVTEDRATKVKYLLEFWEPREAVMKSIVDAVFDNGGDYAKIEQFIALLPCHSSVDEGKPPSPIAERMPEKLDHVAEADQSPRPLLADCPSPVAPKTTRPKNKLQNPRVLFEEALSIHKVYQRDSP